MKIFCIVILNQSFSCSLHWFLIREYVMLLFWFFIFVSGLVYDITGSFGLSYILSGNKNRKTFPKISWLSVDNYPLKLVFRFKWTTASCMYVYCFTWVLDGFIIGTFFRIFSTAKNGLIAEELVTIFCIPINLDIKTKQKR